MITFTVYGVPQPRGSKSPWIPKRADGSPVTKNGRIVIATMDSNKKSRSWMNDVHAAAVAAYRGDLLAGPVSLAIVFYLPRPKSHFGTGRKSGTLKASAPRHHVQKPDSDKLLRGVKDALKGVIYRDDCQVCQERIEKRWCADQARAEIVIAEIAEPAPVETGLFAR